MRAPDWEILAEALVLETFTLSVVDGPRPEVGVEETGAAHAAKSHDLRQGSIYRRPGSVHLLHGDNATRCGHLELLYSRSFLQLYVMVNLCWLLTQLELRYGFTGRKARRSLDSAGWKMGYDYGNAENVWERWRITFSVNVWYI